MKRGYSIVELLLVIGVLSVFLAISIPAIGSAHTAALRKRAVSEATQLAQAVILYKNTYGFWPGEITADPGDLTGRYHSGHNIHDSLPVLISAPQAIYDQLRFDFNGNAASQILHLKTNEVYRAFSRMDLAQAEQDGVRLPNPLNPKGIRFLPLRREGNLDVVDFPDPWGNPYILVFGMNPASMFRHRVQNQAGAVVSSVTISNTTAFAFSLGERGTASTNYLYSMGVKP